MCGILGYSTSKEINNRQKKCVSELCRNLLMETISRGRDATGYVAHYNKTDLSIFYKNNMSTVKFIKKGYFNFKTFPDSLIAHARSATSGDANKNVNNHPFIKGKHGVVHNGTISNWRTGVEYEGLREEMKSECDSELFALYVQKHNNNLKYLARDFKTSYFALAIMRLDNGNIFLVRDGGGPIYIADLSKHLNTVFFSSTQTIFENALDATFSDFPKYTAYHMPMLQVYTMIKGKYSPSYKLIDRYFAPQDIEVEKRVFHGKDLTYLVPRAVTRLFKDWFADEYDIPLQRYVNTMYINEEWYNLRLEDEIGAAERFIEREWDNFTNKHGELDYASRQSYLSRDGVDVYKDTKL